MLQIVIKRSLKFQFFCKTLQQEKWLSCVQSLFSYIPLYKKKKNQYLKKQNKRITKIYTEKSKRGFKIQKKKKKAFKIKTQFKKMKKQIKKR